VPFIPREGRQAYRFFGKKKIGGSSAADPYPDFLVNVPFSSGEVEQSYAVMVSAQRSRTETFSSCAVSARSRKGKLPVMVAAAAAARDFPGNVPFQRDVEQSYTVMVPQQQNAEQNRTT